MTSFNMTSAMRRLVTARDKVARRNDWFGGIIYAAPLQERKGLGTMATDSINVYFDPDFVEENDACIEGVFLHEILHCALDHVARRKWRKFGLWNVACDYAINPLVKRYFPLPGEPIGIDSPPGAKGHLYDQRFLGMRAEAIYDELERMQQQGRKPPPGGDEPQDGEGDGPEGQPGAPDDEDGETDGPEKSGGETASDDEETTPDEQSGRMQEPTPEELEKARAKWREVVSRSTEKGEKAGNLPSDIVRVVNETIPSDKLDWRKILDDWTRDARDNVSLSWRHPGRRSDFVNGVYRPGHELNKVHRLVACIDCSGSISNEYLSEMKAELCSLLEQQLVTEIYLIATDTRIVSEAVVTTPEEVKDFVVHSGGGTQFDKAMDRVKEIDDAMGCVFLTDMMTGSFGRDPGMPVVWVDWTQDGTQQVPFGKVCAL